MNNARYAISNNPPHIMTATTVDPVDDNEKTLSDKLRRYAEDLKNSKDDMRELNERLDAFERKFGDVAALDYINSLKNKAPLIRSLSLLDYIKGFINGYGAYCSQLKDEVNARGQILLKHGHMELSEERNTFLEYIKYCELFEGLNKYGRIVGASFLPIMRSWIEINTIGAVCDEIATAFDNWQYSRTIDILNTLNDSLTNRNQGTPITARAEASATATIAAGAVNNTVNVTIPGLAELLAAMKNNGNAGAANETKPDAAPGRTPGAGGGGNRGGAGDNVDDAEGFFSPAEIARRFGISTDTARKRLDKYRKNHLDGWQPVENRKSTEPAYIYQLTAIRHLFEK